MKWFKQFIMKYLVYFGVIASAEMIGFEMWSLKWFAYLVCMAFLLVLRDYAINHERGV